MNTSIYEHALSVWSNADFNTLQKNLDNNILEIKDRETSSLASRKNLATETKQFKKLDSGEKLAQINKIIKHYQQEIDSLTQRSRAAEKFLFNIYAKLSEAPDPIPLLQNSIAELSKMNDSNKLREHIDDLEEKLNQYSDYDALKKQLLDFEQNSEVTLSKRLIVKEDELNSVWKEKQRHWEDREKDLQNQIERLQESNKSLEAKISKQTDMSGSNEIRDENKNDRSESTTEEKNQTKIDSSEFNLLAQELETTQARVLQLEKRNEELSGTLKRVESETANGSVLHSKNVKINHLETENALLTASLEKERTLHSKKIAKIKDKLQKLETVVSTYKSELDTTSRKLQTYADYDEIKNELYALKRIEFGTSSDIEDSNVNDNNNDIDSINHDKAKTNNVGNTLLAANKKLQSSLSELRVSYNDTKEQNIKLDNKVRELTRKLKEMEEQNIKLEADLEKIDIVEPKFNDTASIMSGISRQINNRATFNGKWSPTSSIIGIPEESKSEVVPSGNINNILPIITKQRDRFRTKNTELEKQLRQYNHEKTNLKNEIMKLKSDNAKLYERVRYLSSYAATHNNRGSSDPVLKKSQNIDTEAQYSNTYEESLHPLASFRKKELDYYRRERLSMLEKLFISFANIILQNKTTRMIFMFYCIGLHGLVFMMSMYVINISGYLTPEVGIVHSATTSVNTHNAAINVGKGSI
ncbi:CCAAT displacement transcription factor COY1 PWA37_002761 [Arxiozyma heterogenica]|uniref:CCAAT displacement transcription factor COY1 n=1 Tax=Arxiozyma heterogenica TaxID=278026 RepID=UPI002EF6FC59